MFSAFVRRLNRFVGSCQLSVSTESSNEINFIFLSFSMSIQTSPCRFCHFPSTGPGLPRFERDNRHVKLYMANMAGNVITPSFPVSDVYPSTSSSIIITQPVTLGDLLYKYRFILSLLAYSFAIVPFLLGSFALCRLHSSTSIASSALRDGASSPESSPKRSSESSSDGL